MRAATRQRLLEPDPYEILLPLDNEVEDVWLMGKEGKWYLDPREHPKVLRK